MTSTLPSRDSVLDIFRRHGCEQVDTPVLQPAAAFLDLSGEDIRRRLLLTQDLDGHELCLRPEHTIPVCREHLARGRPNGQYSYLGPVFRQRSGEDSEFVQAGVEWLGDPDEAGADAAVFGIALEALDLYGVGDLDIVIGDMGLTEGILTALELAPAARRRLVRMLASGQDLEVALAPDQRPASEYAGLLAAIEGQDPVAAKAFVEDVISIAGITQVGGRSAGEIAERFLARAARPSGGMTDKAREVIRRYLRVGGALESIVPALENLARETGLDLDSATERLRARLDRIRDRGLDVSRVRFSAAFTRSLDYYTGFIFEVRPHGAPPHRYAIAGGRYDRLLGQLGSPVPVPAVGCAFWLDRLEGARR